MVDVLVFLLILYLLGQLLFTIEGNLILALGLKVIKAVIWVILIAAIVLLVTLGG